MLLHGELLLVLLLATCGFPFSTLSVETQFEKSSESMEALQFTFGRGKDYTLTERSLP